jgi:hypothetical protein
VNLVLKYKVAGEIEYRCLGVNRIAVGDHGGLTVYAAADGQSECMAVENVEVLSIARIDDSRKVVIH